jgi:G3E family GTPase
MNIPIPLVVLTGFLGSGKTTLLKNVLKDPSMAGTAVIVNEFGDVGLDDALIEAAEEETVLLPSGCVCCAVRDDLVQALKRLFDQAQSGAIPELARVVLETSGLADPAPIAHTLMSENDLFRLYALDGIITTVDAELIENQLQEHFEPAKQIALADRILITKTDRVDEARVEAVEAIVRGLNPAAEIVPIAHGQVTAPLFTGLAAFEPVAAKHHAEGWLGLEEVAASACHNPACDEPNHHHHDGHDHEHGPAPSHRHTHGIHAFAITYDEPIDGMKLSFAIELLRQHHGHNLLRVKAIANVAGEPLPFVIHGVQHIFYPPTTLEAWPSNDRRSRFVFITKDLDEDKIRTVLDGLLAPQAHAKSVVPDVAS